MKTEFKTMEKATKSNTTIVIYCITKPQSTTGETEKKERR